METSYDSVVKVDLFTADLCLDVGARNERRFCAVNCSKTPGFEVIHGLLDRCMLILQVKPTGDDKALGYHIRKGTGTSSLIRFCLTSFLNVSSRYSYQNRGRVSLSWHLFLFKHFDLTANRTPVAWIEIQSANHYPHGSR